jgi:hypothetical protein
LGDRRVDPTVFASGGTLDETTLIKQFAQAKQLGQKVFQESQAMITSKQQAIATGLQELQQLLRSGTITQQDYLVKLRESIRNQAESIGETN